MNKEKRCWFCGRTNEEAYEQGNGVSANNSDPENCLIDYKTYDEYEIPVCRVCLNIIDSQIMKFMESDEENSDISIYVVKKRFKKQLIKLIENL